MLKKIKEKRKCYFVMQTQVNADNEFNALVAVENERGFYKTDWFWGKDLDQAEKIAEEKNKVMGISKDEANKIVLSTMRKQ